MMLNRLIALLLFAWAGLALADTPPARVINSLTYDAAGNAITSTVSGGKRGLDSNISNALATPGNIQVIVSGAAVDPRVTRALTTSDQVSCAQLGTWNVLNVSGTVSLPTNAAQETGGNLASAATSLTSLNGKITTFDLDTGVGTQNVQGVSLRFSASGGSVEAGTASNPFRTDPTGSTTQPVSASSWPLPTGASTAGNQVTANNSLASIDGKLTNTTGGALKTDSSGFTQPVSAASLPLPTGASTSGNQVTTNSTLSTINGKLFTNLTSDATKVDGSSFVQPVSGTVTANQGGSWTVTANQGGTWNVNNVSGTISLPTGASTSTAQTTGNNSLASIDGKLPTALGQTTMANSLAVVLASNQSAIPVSQSATWNINNVSGTISLPTGASTEASLAKLTLAQGSTTSGQTGALVMGAVTTAAPSYTTAQSSPLSLTLAGALRVDASATTQPVSAATLPLPAGASTSSNQATANSSLSSIDGKLNSLGQKTMANSTPVTLASDQTTLPVSIAATPPSPTGRSYADSVRNVYSSTNVTTGAWVQLIASTAAVINALHIADSCGKALELGVGGAGSESRVFIIPAGGPSEEVRLHINASSRLSVRALDTTCSLGELVITGLQ